MRKIPRTILIICTILTLIFIWGQSVLPGDISSQQSGFVMGIVRPFLELFAGKGNVTEHLVRKLAHFTEFSVLGVEAGFIFGIYIRNRSLNPWIALLKAVASCAFAALIDETIQIFSGRGPAITDVWIDTAGALLGAAIVLLVISLIKRGREANE